MRVRLSWILDGVRRSVSGEAQYPPVVGERFVLRFGNQRYETPRVDELCLGGFDAEPFLFQLGLVNARYYS